MSDTQLVTLRSKLTGVSRRIADRLVPGERGCLEWPGETCDGYGRLRINGKHKSVHRVIYEALNGPVFDGLKVLHKCDNRKCANPKHLFLGTVGDNNRDRDEKGRTARGDKMPHAKLNYAIVYEARRRCAAGETVTDVAAEFGVNRMTLYFAVTGAKWKHVEMPPFKPTRSGARNGRAQLTEQQVFEIREASKAGERYASIAKRYPLTPEGVSNIARGITWKSL